MCVCVGGGLQHGGAVIAAVCEVGLVHECSQPLAKPHHHTIVQISAPHPDHGTAPHGTARHSMDRTTPHRTAPHRIRSDRIALDGGIDDSGENTAAEEVGEAETEILPRLSDHCLEPLA